MYNWMDYYKALVDLCNKMGVNVPNDAIHWSSKKLCNYYHYLLNT
ncbi:hypothetical protein [Scopulibacillus darangshiensis]|nr:hypothetical protein [Scopulibacillus darangshiensis]